MCDDILGRLQTLFSCDHVDRSFRTTCQLVASSFNQDNCGLDTFEALYNVLQDSCNSLSDNIARNEDLLMLLKSAVLWLLKSHGIEKNNKASLLTEQYLDIINILSETSVEAKNLYVKKFSQLYLDILLTDLAVEDFRHKLEVLRSFNLLLEDTSGAVKEDLLLCPHFVQSLKKITLLLNDVGDYEFQVCIAESLFRITPKRIREEVISSLFQDEKRRESFMKIRDNEFETDCRLFLNQLNMSLKGTHKVFALPCCRAWLGDKELHKPDDPNYETFWADFNGGSKRLTVFCGSYNSSEVSGEDLWETLTVWKEDIHSFNVKKVKKVKIVNILLSKMVSDIYPSQQDVSGRSVRLQFPLDCKIEEALERTFGIEKGGPKVSTVSTPLPIAREEMSQDMESEDIPSTPIEPIVRRHKVSVPDVPMSAMMSPSCSISSKASEPVTAVRINSSKTQMKSSVGSTIKKFQTPEVPKKKERVKTPVVTVTPPSKNGNQFKHKSEDIENELMCTNSASEKKQICKASRPEGPILPVADEIDPVSESFQECLDTDIHAEYCLTAENFDTRGKNEKTIITRKAETASFQETSQDVIIETKSKKDNKKSSKSIGSQLTQCKLNSGKSSERNDSKRNQIDQYDFDLIDKFPKPKKCSYRTEDEIPKCKTVDNSEELTNACVEKGSISRKADSLDEETTTECNAPLRNISVPKTDICDREKGKTIKIQKQNFEMTTESDKENVSNNASFTSEHDKKKTKLSGDKERKGRKTKNKNIPSSLSKQDKSTSEVSLEISSNVNKSNKGRKKSRNRNADNKQNGTPDATEADLVSTISNHAGKPVSEDGKCGPIDFESFNDYGLIVIDENSFKSKRNFENVETDVCNISLKKVGISENSSNVHIVKQNDGKFNSVESHSRGRTKRKTSSKTRKDDQKVCNESKDNCLSKTSFKFAAKRLPSLSKFEDSGIVLDAEAGDVTISTNTINLQDELKQKNEPTSCENLKQNKIVCGHKTTTNEMNTDSNNMNMDENALETLPLSFDGHSCDVIVIPSSINGSTSSQQADKQASQDFPVVTSEKTSSLQSNKQVSKKIFNANNRNISERVKSVKKATKQKQKDISEVGKYSLRKRNKQKLKEAYKSSDTEEILSQSDGSNESLCFERLQSSPNEIPSRLQNSSDIYSSSRKMEKSSALKPLSEKSRKFFRKNTMSQYNNGSCFTSTTVQKIDSSTCFGFESPTHGEAIEKSCHSKRRVVLLMSYSQTDGIVPYEKGDAGSDPYDFDAECDSNKNANSHVFHNGISHDKVYNTSNNKKYGKSSERKKNKSKVDNVASQNITNNSEEDEAERERKGQEIVVFKKKNSLNKPILKKKSKESKYMTPELGLFQDDFDVMQDCHKKMKSRKKVDNKKPLSNYDIQMHHQLQMVNEDSNLVHLDLEREKFPSKSKIPGNKKHKSKKSKQDISSKDKNDKLKKNIHDNSPSSLLELEDDFVSCENGLEKSSVITTTNEDSYDLVTTNSEDINRVKSRKHKPRKTRKTSLESEVGTDDTLGNELGETEANETTSILDNFSNMCKKIVGKYEEDNHSDKTVSPERLPRSTKSKKLFKTPNIVPSAGCKTPVTPGNIKKLYKSLDISVIKTPKTPASGISENDEFNISEVLSQNVSQKFQQENACTPSSAISKILSRSLASVMDFNETDLLDFNEATDKSVPPSEELTIPKTDKRVKQKKSGLISGPSTTARPSKTSLKRKYNSYGISDIDESQDDCSDQEDKLYIPRKLFKEQSFIMEEHSHTNEMSSSLESYEALSDIDPTAEISTLLKAFSHDVQRHIGEKRRHLDSLTKAVLKSSQKNMNALLLKQQQKRNSVMNRYQESMMKELMTLDKDMSVLKEAEDNALNFFKHQMKQLQQFRQEQEKRLLNVLGMHTEMKDKLAQVENVSSKQNMLVKSKLKEDLLSLQNKLLFESQKEEIYHVKRNLETIFF